jgi:O-antigen/teichoic acid export membrane protein
MLCPAVILDFVRSCSVKVSLKVHVSPNRRLLGGMVGGILFTAVSVIVSLLQFSILLRRLPLLMAGIWMIFTNLGSYVLFLDLGLSPTLGREISFAAGEPGLTPHARAVRVKTLVHSCTTVVFALALLVALVGAPAGWRYLRTIVPSTLSSEARVAWCVYIVGAALNLVGEGWFAGIYGLGHVFQEKIIRTTGSVAGLLFMTVAVFSRSGFIGLALAYVLQSVCVLLMARLVLLRLTTSPPAKGNFDRHVIGRLIGPSLKYAATLLGGILILQTDNIVIASTLGPAAVPNYQVVAKMITILMSLSMMLVMASAPLVSQAFAQHDHAALLRLLSRNLRFSLGIMVVLGSFIACFTDRFIYAWLGPNHFVGFRIVWVLLAVMLLEAHHQAMASATMATGRIVFLAPALTAGVLNIFFSVIFARRFGLIGVVFGTMAAQVLTNNWYVPWYTMRLFGLSFLNHLRTVLLPLLGLIGAMLSVGYAVRLLTARLPAILSVCIGALCILIAGAICFTIMFNRVERTLVFARLRALSFRQTAIITTILPE